MSEHTKGQWKVMWSEGHAWGPRRIITPKGKDERVAVVSLRGAPQGNPVTAEANARLIAAAPELLGVLEELMERFDDNVDGDTYLVLCRAMDAVAKAKGGTE